MKMNTTWDGALDPDTKAWERGVETLADSELLAIILRTGSTGRSAVDIASRVLARGGRQLLNLLDMDLVELMSVEGIGRVKALQLKAVGELSRRIASSRRRPGLCFRDAGSIAAYYMESLRHLSHETLMAAAFDIRGGFLGDRIISVGTLDSALFSPREVFLFALGIRARFVVILHNHPSGDPTPSGNDDACTRQIHQSGEMLGITLLDHIIIGDQVFYSYREHYRFE